MSLHSGGGWNKENKFTREGEGGEGGVKIIAHLDTCDWREPCGAGWAAAARGDIGRNALYTYIGRVNIERGLAIL